MLHKPNAGELVFEASIYNKEVRSLVKENQSHDIYDDHWADCRKHDVCARNEDEARRMIADRYSSDDGFVIEGMTVTAV